MESRAAYVESEEQRITERLQHLRELEESLQDKEKTLHHMSGTPLSPSSSLPTALPSETMLHEAISDGNNWWAYVWHELKKDDKRNAIFSSSPSEQKATDINNAGDDSESSDTNEVILRHATDSGKVGIDVLQKIEKLQNIIRSQAIEITSLRQVDRSSIRHFHRNL